MSYLLLNPALWTKCWCGNELKTDVTPLVVSLDISSHFPRYSLFLFRCCRVSWSRKVWVLLICKFLQAFVNRSDESFSFWARMTHLSGLMLFGSRVSLFYFVKSSWVDSAICFAVVHLKTTTHGTGVWILMVSFLHIVLDSSPNGNVNRLCSIIGLQIIMRRSNAGTLCP